MKSNKYLKLYFIKRENKIKLGKKKHIKYNNNAKIQHVIEIWKSLIATVS